MKKTQSMTLELNKNGSFFDSLQLYKINKFEEKKD